MKKYLAIVCIFLFTGAKAQEQLSAGADSLFKNNKSKLTNSEKNWLFSQLKITPNNRIFKSGNNDVTAQVFVTDLNKDGVEEVFMQMQCPALFGDFGTVMMYTHNNKNGFDRQDELGDGFIMILDTKKTGYPDIAIAGPGSAWPIYSWDSGKYKLSSKKLLNADLESKKVNYIDISQANMDYITTLK